jgi:hypothetical protein
MAHVQKPDFVFRRNGRFHLNRQGRQFSRLLAAEVCTSACRVCTGRASLCSAVMWRLLVTHSTLLFPLHFSSRTSPCAITFQTQSTYVVWDPFPRINTYCHTQIPYIIHNPHETVLLCIAPKLTARYIHNFYKAAHNIPIPSTPIMSSTLYFTCPFY